MPEMIQIEGGDVLANLEDRTITGRLVPYGEEGRTNLGRFSVEAGTIDITDAAADPSVIGLNTDHDRTGTIGRASRVWEQPDGIYATWTIAHTPAGDAALADAIAAGGHRKRLSGEFGPAVIRAGKLVAGHAKLWGSALVNRGAFPSAMVLATDTPDTDPTEGATMPTTPAATVTPPAAAPATPATPSPAAQVAASAIPATLTPPASPAPQLQARDVDLNMVLASIAAVKMDPRDADATQVLAALTDIKIDGTGALPASGVLQPTWLGQLYQGIPYVREYIGLTALGSQISAAGKKGYRMNRGSSASPLSPTGIPNGGGWAGNKSDINSYGGFTETAASFLRRFAVGHDIAREFYDLPGGAEVIEAFLRLVIEDHLIWSDSWALYDIQDVAGAPVAADTSSYPTNYPKALGMLIQGILAVKARKTDKRRDVPTFAVANTEAYEKLVYAAGGDQNLPAFVSIAVNTASGGTVDGNVTIVEGETGIAGSESVIVGGSMGLEHDELGANPLRIDALDLARGGIDRAVFGYLQTFKNRPEGYVHIGTAPAWAQGSYERGAQVTVSSKVLRATGITTAGQTDNPNGEGLTGATAPSLPGAVGGTVTDNKVIWTRIN